MSIWFVFIFVCNYLIQFVQLSSQFVQLDENIDFDDKITFQTLSTEL